MRFKKYLYPFLLSLLVCGCQKESGNSDKEGAFPLSNVNTQSHKIKYLFDASDSSSSLSIEKFGDFILPGIPYQTLEIDPLLIIVFGHFENSSKPWARLINLRDTSVADIELPENHVFRHAGYFKEKIVSILYDVINFTNHIYVFDLEKRKIELSSAIQKEINFSSNHEINVSIQKAGNGQSIYFCAAEMCFSFDGEKVSEQHIGPGWELVELASEGSDIYGLYSSSGLTTNNTFAGNQNLFMIYDIVKDKLATRILDPEALPFDLKVKSGRYQYSVARNDSDLLRIFEIDLQKMTPSGLLNFGHDNSEGRIAWSQAYYLDAFMTLLHRFSPASRLRTQIRSRLDLEILMINKLLGSSKSMSSRRYSFSRKNYLYASHTGRLLKLLKKYKTLFPGGAELDKLADFQERVENLQDHVDEIVIALGDEFVPDGTYFLRSKKGAAVPYDGTKLPFNIQNDWAAAVSYNHQNFSPPAGSLTAAKDLVTTFINFEDLPGDSLSWRYGWGETVEGWSESDNISENNPEFSGVNYEAHISYRSIDANSTLLVGKVFPELVTDDLLVFFKHALENGMLYLWVSENLESYGVNLEIPKSQLIKYARFNEPSQMHNAVFALDFLSKK